AHAAARAKRHARVMPLLGSSTGSSTWWQGNDHVGHIAVRFHDRNWTTIAHSLMGNGSGCVEVLVDKGGRDLQRSSIVIVAALDIVGGQQRRYVDVEAQQIANGIIILTAVQATQWHTYGNGFDRRSIQGV